MSEESRKGQIQNDIGTDSMGAVSQERCNSSLLTRIVRKQIENSLRESAPKAMDVTNAVLELNEHLQRLAKIDPSHRSERMVSQEKYEFSKSINAALMGLQFYDRLSQQLWQAVDTLQKLEGMLDDGERVSRELDCTGVAVSARRQYPTESEREVFDRELRGELNTRPARQCSSDASGVELFD